MTNLSFTLSLFFLWYVQKSRLIGKKKTMIMVEISVSKHKNFFF